MAGSLKDCPGTPQLSGINAYSGGTTITSGLLTLNSISSRLGTGNVNVQASAIGTELQILSGVQNAIADTATLSLFELVLLLTAGSML